VGEGSSEQRKEEEEWKERGSWGEMQGEGTLLVRFGSEGADLKELRVGFNCGRGLEKRRRTGGHGSKMLGREGVTHIDRVCILGAMKGDRGRARNLGGLQLVPETECLQGREEERERREEG